MARNPKHMRRRWKRVTRELNNAARRQKARTGSEFLGMDWAMFVMHQHRVCCVDRRSGKPA